MVQLLDAASAERVPTVHQDARDSLAHIVLHGTELADVQAARLVVQVHHSGTHLAAIVVSGWLLLSGRVYLEGLKARCQVALLGVSGIVEEGNKQVCCLLRRVKLILFFLADYK